MVVDYADEALVERLEEAIIKLGEYVEPLAVNYDKCHEHIVDCDLKEAMFFQVNQRERHQQNAELTQSWLDKDRQSPVFL